MKTKENTDLYSPLQHSSRISCLCVVFSSFLIAEAFLTGENKEEELQRRL